jgi:hypothetical protein
MAKMETLLVFFLVAHFATVLSQSNKALKLGFTTTESEVQTLPSSSFNNEIESDPFFDNSADIRFSQLIYFW